METNKLNNSLFDRIKEVLEDRKIINNNDYNNVKGFVNKEDKTAGYIKELFKSVGLESKIISKNYIKNSLSNKITHTLFTFFLGLLVCKFDDLETKIEKEYEKYFKEKDNIFLKVWTITSIFHDYGYAYITKNKDKLQGIEELSKIKVDNNIFEYEYENEEIRYSRNLLEAYFSEFAKKKKKATDEKDKEEYLEHGTIGGYVLFDEMIKNKMKFNDVDDNYLYQNICYRIMEHNIWKITDDNKFFDEFDKEKVQEVYKNNFKIIYDNEPLLFLLSLCDTIEHVKKLHTKNKKGKTANTRVTTFAKKIGFEVTSDSISINYIDVKKEVETGIKKRKAEQKEDDPEPENEFEKWKSGIIGLNGWVNVDIDDSDEKWTISKKS